MSKNKTLYPSQDLMLESTTITGRPLLELISEIQSLYLEDLKPWVIGFSGGKDSTAVLSLIYTALQKLEPNERRKHIYVVSSDTLVETPMVVDMITSTIDQINKSAPRESLPISAHIVVPKMEQSFWTNLLGKGYPAPTQQFRWCTERMKIDPVSEFILDKVTRFGEVVVVLGARSDESASRAQVIAKHKIEGSKLSRHSSLPGAFTYMPIESWSFDDVWMYLLGAPAPWGGDHFELFELYKGSNAGECPLVIDTKTPSCGNSRFGCWTCTVVTKDRAIDGLIESGETWLLDLKKFRNKLYRSTDPDEKEKYRNFKRRTGKVQYARKSTDESSELEVKTIPGPYWLEQRQKWLKELLTIEKKLNDEGRKITLIRVEELYAIRREWMFDPNEPDWADSLPGIYREVYGRDLDWPDKEAGTFTQVDADLLKELGQKYETPHELAMKLIELEHSMDGLSRRKGLFGQINSLLNQDWGSLDEINSKNEANRHKPGIKVLKAGYDEELKKLTSEYEKL
ncbi:MAG: DNA phosphorothioation system sulfurtransferase DndC [Gammaproteobacteria bacterium]|nr:DNA phosphorothioation system sulfurtransferase DndC [Gammaproteobacteria bacterium]